jgi:TolB-like protein
MGRVMLALLVASVSATAHAAPMRVAVLEFQSGAGADADGLGKGLQSMITTDLAQVRAFELVERARLADLQAETKLAKSGLVDPATAVRLGKLAGATHLVAGTFTVVGAKMRLDTRLFAVADGKILLAEEIAGDKDAFFELEKALVGKVIQAAGVTLQPKERAEVARVHTADFEAFRRFSQGVTLFDQKQYDEALAALRDAGSRDANFALARVTLAEYERTITELRAKADAIAAAQAQKERLEKEASIRDEVQMLEKLYALAARTGTAAQIERLAALHALALIIGTSDGYGHHDKLRRVDDEFVLQRTADTIWRSYFAESSAVFPLVPFSPSIELSASLPQPATFDHDFAAFIGRMKDFQCGGFDHAGSLLYFSLNKIDDLARRLLLDRRKEAELRARAIALGPRVPAPDSWRRDRELERARNLRDIGEYGPSTAVYSSLGAGEKEPARLEELAREIETNRGLQTTVDKSPLRPLARELLMTMPGTWSDDVQVEVQKALPGMTRPTAWLLYVLTRGRRLLDENAYVLVGDSPVWQVRGGDGMLTTGPRTDPLRATELRYYRRASDPDVLVVVDGVPRRDLTARYELAFAPPADWWPGMQNPGRGSAQPGDLAAAKLDPGRPEVAFVFGATDVTGELHPLRSLQLVVAEDAVRLVAATQADRWKPAERKVLEEQAVDLRGQKRVEVVVKLDGATLSATVNGRALAFQAPAERTGFYGFQFRGPGYAAVTRFAIAGK